MIKIVGNDITRAGQKIGWLSGNDVYDEEGRMVGYFSEAHGDIFDHKGRKLGYFENNYLKTIDGKNIRTDEIRKRVSGGSYADLERAAVFLLIGD